MKSCVFVLMVASLFSFRSIGAIEFGPVSEYPTGQDPLVVHAVDLNGDGNCDLVVPNTGEASVSILIGDGFGAFSARVNYGVGSAARGVASSDLNADSLPDLVVTDAAADSISVLINNGDGTFGALLPKGYTPSLNCHIAGHRPRKSMISSIIVGLRFDYSVCY